MKSTLSINGYLTLEEKNELEVIFCKKEILLTEVNRKAEISGVHDVFDLLFSSLLMGDFVRDLLLGKVIEHIWGRLRDGINRIQKKENRFIRSLEIDQTVKFDKGSSNLKIKIHISDVNVNIDTVMTKLITKFESKQLDKAVSEVLVDVDTNKKISIRIKYKR